MQRVGEHAGDQFYLPASKYSFDQLAEIYSQARVDYIVPMPMNGKRMEEYVHAYDVDLSASVVSLTHESTQDSSPTGVIMLGVRGDRSWVTRLGVIPTQRRHKVGQFLMELSIQKSRERKVRQVQLEVIKGNLPAFQLFRKLGFVEIRELLVIRRPPSEPDAALAPAGLEVTPLDAADLPTYLRRREARLAWTEETPSLLNSGRLKGLRARLPSGETGWAIYLVLPFQLAHIVLSPGVSVDMAQALLYEVHKHHPMYDTKVENLPREHPAWPAFQKLGYFEAFGRIEMYLTL